MIFLLLLLDSQQVIVDCANTKSHKTITIDAHLPEFKQCCTSSSEIKSVAHLLRRYFVFIFMFCYFFFSETMTALVAFIWGLIALGGLTNADVSHLQLPKSQYSSSGQTFVANNGQFVRQSFNSNGNPSFSSRTYNSAASGNTNNENAKSNNRYWWLRNTDNNQQSTENQNQNTQQHSSASNYMSAAGCTGCASPKLRLNRQNTNTQHQQPHNTASYIRQNSFTNVKQQQPNSLPTFNSHNQHKTASVSGTNNFQNFDSGRFQQQSTCTDSNSACVAQKFCNSGFIDSSFEAKAVRSAVSVENL